MDETTLHPWKAELFAPGTNRVHAIPPLLTESETAAFKLCAVNNTRIEQERIPRAAVVEAVNALRNGCSLED